MAGPPWTLLYDGHCPFCTRSARNVVRLLGADRVIAEDFQAPGVLDRHPGVTREACMQKVHAVSPEGHIYAGAEAFARMFAELPIVGRLASLYYVPGVRQVADGVYDLVARKRYRWFGRSARCEEGVCRVHGR